MKKILLYLSLIALPALSFAQKVKDHPWQDLSFLSGQSKINLVIDFSEATILNMDATDFISQESDWEKGVVEMRTKFIQAFNNKSKVRAANSTDTDYTLTIIPLTVTEKGSHVKGNLRITDKGGNEIFLHSFNNEAGMFGSAINLMGDAFEDLGEKLGKTFKKYAR